MRPLLKNLQVLLAVYAMLVFSFGTMITQAVINAKSGPIAGPGIWVRLCASGQKVFMPLPAGSEMPEDNGGGGDPAPTNGGSKACHACNDRRVDEGDNVDDLVV